MSRPLLILVASIAALLVAGIVVVIGVVAPDARGADSDPVERLRFLSGVFFKGSYAPVIALGLAFAGIALGIAARIRSVFYYVIAGGVIGLASSYGVDLFPALENTTDIAPVIFGRTISVIAGMAGGLTYWAIAARRATAGVATAG